MRKPSFETKIGITIFFISAIMLTVSLLLVQKADKNNENKYWNTECIIADSTIETQQCEFSNCAPVYSLYCTYNASISSDDIIQMNHLMSSTDIENVLNKQDGSCNEGEQMYCYVRKSDNEIMFDIGDGNSGWKSGIGVSISFMLATFLFYVMPYTCVVCRIKYKGYDEFEQIPEQIERRSFLDPNRPVNV